MTPHTIYFVRHGETVWNVDQRLQGRSDSPLTPLGEEQARANAETLLEAVPHLRDLQFVVSPLGRARATMTLIRRHLGLREDGYVVDERLAEMSFGAWEGLTLKAVRSTYPDIWAAREASKWTYLPPGGGESYHDVSLRLLDWVQSLSGDVVVVAHGAVGRVLRGLNVAMPTDQIPFSVDPGHDRVYRLIQGTEAAL